MFFVDVVAFFVFYFVAETLLILNMITVFVVFNGLSEF